MTRLALTALATAAAYVIGWKSASAWWGRCASGCRRGASNGAGSVSVDPRAVSGRETGAQDDPRECGWLGCGHPQCADVCNAVPLDEYRTWRKGTA